MIDAHGSRVEVESSSIASILYGDDAVLEVEFHRGTRYRYFTVPQRVFDELLTADSKGTYLNEHIKGRYAFERLGDRR